jgi:hypothetical protein
MTMGRRIGRGAGRRASAGQAVVEMAVGLIAIMVVLTAVIQIGMLCREHSDTMTTARREAAGFAMAPDHIQPMSGGYVLNWRVGPDGQTYSRDDRPITGSPLGEEAGAIAAHVDAGALEAWVPGNPLSRLSYASSLIEEFALVRGHHPGSVTNLPVTRRLMYNNHASTIDVESEAWLVWTGGLY